MFSQVLFGNYSFGNYSSGKKVNAAVKLLMVLSLVSSFSHAGQDLDPTKPFSDQRRSGKVTKNAPLVLQSIIRRENNRIAVINNKALKVGDEIGLYQVVAINSKSVVLNSLQQRIELSLFTNVVAKSQ